jgi:hypothetical protein
VPGGRDQSLEGICQDPNQVASTINHTPFIEGKAQGVGSCEWGNVRRASDYTELVGAKIFRKRSAVVTQAIIVHQDSPYRRPEDLANVPISVHFHAGSYYSTLHMLGGYMAG